MNNFTELATKNPCEGCPAPCCQMQVLPWIPPKNLMGIDHIRFCLQFPATEFVVSEVGEFSIIKWVMCSLFNDKKCTCSVHGTPKQPLTCVHFNPYQCWYKRNFVDAIIPPNVYRLNLERYEIWVKKIEFDESHNIISFPSFQDAQNLIRDIPITPLFKKNDALKKTGNS